MGAPGGFMKWLSTRTPPDQQRWGREPDAFDAGAVTEQIDRLSRLFSLDDDDAYFPLKVAGWENLPDSPTLLVCNHNGGTSFPDAWGLGYAWYRHFGSTRPVHTLAHELVFALRVTGSWFSKLGILRADPEMGLEVLTKHKRDLVVFPGGDRDTWRPYRDRYKVCFAGRKGYAKLAIRAQVPIVPIANAGAHETLVVLTDGQRLARKLKFKELFRASIFPVHLSLPFGLTFGPTPHLPMPTTFRYQIGTPIQPPVWAPGTPITQEMIDDLDARVRAAMQEQLDVLSVEAVPLRERARALGRRLLGRVPPRARLREVARSSGEVLRARIAA